MMILGATGLDAAGKRRKGRGGHVFGAGALATCAFFLCLCWGAFSPALAADLGGEPQGGVPCSIGQPFWVPSKATAETLPWSAVYLGHFSGGRPYLVPDGRTLVDWRDEYVCFPSSAQCRAWLRASYRTYHWPEGYRACLFLR
jgi:hypothetical protein